MVGTKLYNPKHNAVGVVADEPQTASGYWTIHYPDLGIYRRYNTEKVRDLAQLLTELDSIKFMNAETGEEVYPLKNRKAIHELFNEFGVVLGMSQATSQRRASAVSTKDAWLYFSVIQGGKR